MGFKDRPTAGSVWTDKQFSVEAGEEKDTVRGCRHKPPSPCLSGRVCLSSTLIAQESQQHNLPSAQRKRENEIMHSRKKQRQRTENNWVSHESCFKRKLGLGAESVPVLMQEEHSLVT